MSDQFDNPGTVTGIKWEEQDGRLLLFTVHEYVASIQTQYGEGSAVRVDMTVLDGPNAGEGYAQALVFPKVLQGQLRGSVGKKVLGRLGKGEAKKGQSAPWKLADANANDQAVARAHLATDDTPPW